MSGLPAFLRDLHKCAFFDKHLPKKKEKHTEKRHEKDTLGHQIAAHMNWTSEVLDPVKALKSKDCHEKSGVLLCFDSGTCCSPFQASGGPSCPSRCTLCGPDAAGSPEGGREMEGDYPVMDGREDRG